MGAGDRESRQRAPLRRRQHIETMPSADAHLPAGHAPALVLLVPNLIFG